MRLYGIALFIHMTGLIALFDAFVIQQRMGAKVRATAGTDEMRHWAGMLDATRPMAPSGAGMMLLSGAYMTWAMWRQMPPCIQIGFAAVAFIGVAMTMAGARFAALHRAASDPAAVAAMRRGSRWALLCAANGAALGTVWIMSIRPAMLECVLAAALPAAIGWMVGLRLARGAA